MAKILPDTNILIDTPEVLLNTDFQFVIPYTVLAELDGLKKNPDLRAPAQYAIKMLWAVHKEDPERITFVDLPNQANTNDEKIVISAKNHSAKLLSNDIGANVIAEIFGCPTAYDVEDSSYDKDYSGTREVSLDYKDASNLIGSNELLREEAEHYFGTMVVNEYVYYQMPSDHDKYSIWRLYDDGIVRLVKQSVKPFTAAGFHFVPADPVQACAIDAIMDSTTPLTVIEGRVGSGKAQPLDAIIHTPSGPSRMGDMVVGQSVIGSNGKPTTVTGVFPQGKKKAYRVTLQDGSSTVCCDEHLWTVYDDSGRAYTKELKDIMLNYKRPLYDKRYDSIQYNYKWRVPTVSPVEYFHREIPLNPYLLGALIGDGSLGNSICITSVDQYIMGKVMKSLPDNHKLSDTQDPITKRIVPEENGKNEVLNTIRNLGLNCKSEHKFIPRNYMYNSIEVRLELLRGLMDTDGCVNKDGSIEYTTVSERLAKDIQQLIRSFGGKATVTSRYTKYTHKNEVRIGQLAYRLHINMQNCQYDIFSLPRKVARLTPSRSWRQSIANIEYIGEADMQCISVDAEDSLYVTDDYIVTHNTLCALVGALAKTCGQHSYKAYDRICVTRSPMPIDKQLQLGFMPGDLLDKMGQWILGIKSNLKFLYERNKKDVENEEAEKVFSEFFEALSLESIQGISLHNRILLVDEYELLSADGLQQVLSRIAEGSKVVLIGDSAQTYGANRGREGYKKLLPHLKGSPLVSYVKMHNIYRSELTEFVESIFK